MVINILLCQIENKEKKRKIEKCKKGRETLLVSFNNKMKKLKIEQKQITLFQSKKKKQKCSIFF